MNKRNDEKSVSSIGDLAKRLRKFDQLLTGKFLEDFSMWWEEDGEKQFLNWKNQDYQEEKLEELKNNPEESKESEQPVNKEFLNEADTAMYIGMSTAFLRQARCHGQIGNRTPGPPYYKIGRAVRYNINDLDKWLEENKRWS